jgi:hypothetical protein
MNFQLYNDKVWTIPLKCKDATGADKPFPTSPVAVSSNPASLGVAIGQSPWVLILTPKVQTSPGLVVTLSSVGADGTTFVVDIVADPNRLSVSVDSLAATSTVQNIPTAPGP